MKMLLTLILLTGAIGARAQEKAKAPVNPDTGERVTYETSPYRIRENIPVAALKDLFKQPGMPIVSLPNTSTNMPIIKTDRTKYNMPVLGYQPKSIKQQKIDSVRP